MESSFLIRYLCLAWGGGGGQDLGLGEVSGSLSANGETVEMLDNLDL